MAAAINLRHRHRGSHLAFRLRLEEVPLDGRGLLDHLVGKLRKATETRGFDSAARRLRAAGRITLLFDSLDQAGPTRVVPALEELMSHHWAECRIWISGRPWAFRQASPILRNKHPNTPWQFVRVGQLLPPKCKFLLETIRRPSQR